MSGEDTVETQDWSNRELLLRIYYRTVETNGSVRLLDRTVFGDQAHGISGLVEQAHENTLYRERAKVGVKLALSVAGAGMSILVAMLVLLIEHVGG